MRTDHRRPLVAYVLVSVACAFVVAPSLDLGGLGLGPRPTFSAFSDTTMTPSEAADRVIDPTLFAALPDAEILEPPVTDEGSPLAPGLAVIEGVLGGPIFGSDGDVDGSADAGSATPDSDGGSTQLVAGPPRSGLVGGADAGGDGSGSEGGPASPADPETSDGSGALDGVPSDDGGPEASPADGGAGAEAPGPENGHGHGNGHGHASAAPAPHSFDHATPGDHPYGQVGPPSGAGSKDDGPQDRGPKDKQSRAEDAKATGPQGKAHGHGKGHGRSDHR